MVCRPLIQTILLDGCLAVALSSLSVAQQPPSSNAPAAQTIPSFSTRPDFSHARTLMQQGKVDDAIAELEVLEASVPNTKGLDLELGIAYYKKSDYVKAIGFLKSAAADPGNNEAVQLLGLSYYLGGHPAEAIPLLEKVQGWFP